MHHFHVELSRSSTNSTPFISFTYLYLSFVPNLFLSYYFYLRFHSWFCFVILVHEKLKYAFFTLLLNSSFLFFIRSKCLLQIYFNISFWCICQLKRIMPPSEDFVYEPKLRNTRERNDKNQIVSNSYVSY